MRSQLQGLADTQLRMEKSACLTEAFAEEVDKVGYAHYCFFPSMRGVSSQQYRNFVTVLFTFFSPVLFSLPCIQACLVINSALAAGISWDDISTMVAAETSAGDLNLWWYIL